MKYDLEKLRKVIAIDFDSTICETNYPDIIKPMPYAIWALNALQQHGYIIILNTCRIEQHEDWAVDYLFNQGFVPDLVNENHKDRINMFGGDCRKISADIYIDDKTFGIKITDTFWMDVVNALVICGEKCQ